ncbi:hypothetical protein QIW46_03850 [Pseudomonas fluorescens]|uniref:hypothetical protein n=1 Tax=Pseudomonas fluorescens TaxID=294 RepID=UPI003524B3CD
MSKYAVANQWGGSSAPWHPGGTWVLGGRDNQNVVAIEINSRDDGKTFTGTMTYARGRSHWLQSATHRSEPVQRRESVGWQ